MSIRQVLLSLQTFPDAVPERALEGACTLAQLLGAHLTVHLPQLDSDRSTWPPVMGAFPLDFPNLMQELVTKSEANAAAMAETVTRLAAAYGVALDVRRLLTTAYASPEPLVDLARLHDLTILPVPETDGFNRSCVQATLFGSGRPVVLLPSQRRRLQALDRIMLAWDYSREAARALADAMPLLGRAREVRVVTVLGEKHVNSHATRGDLEKLLCAHGLRYSLSNVALDGDDIGPFLMDQAVAADADLLVMGGYGHTRLREFVLGGATRGVLREPLLPVFLSH
jgi:nucleotide-binding universal stress UspA family protein